MHTLERMKDCVKLSVDVEFQLVEKLAEFKLCEVVCSPGDV